MVRFRLVLVCGHMFHELLLAVLSLGLEQCYTLVTKLMLKAEASNVPRQLLNSPSVFSAPAKPSHIGVS